MIGIGQSLRRDDAVGLIAVQQWQEAHPEMSAKVAVEVSETPGLNLLHQIQGYQAAIIVDAIQSGAPAGTIHLLREEQLAAFGRESQSAHGWGIAETLALGKKLFPSSMPSRIVLLGIELDTIQIGEGLSDPVRSALPRLVHAIQLEIERLTKERMDSEF